MSNEAIIIINEQQLTEAQSATIRVALEGFALNLGDGGLGDDNHGKAMTKIYQDRISEIRKPLYKNSKKS